ncbi:YpiF family protein [Paenibacillus sp. sptzw28]|uniref:DUF2487 family protein n=1 Tax=Paenibacillus sp. sptzw28 TaxID=715179 RepID=UPI001C6DED79|nr:DUF2487 family protein [Paenibacillus sp. sptzw28]QYR19886.1 YpiF family protein [Paenibacillus sp. sptzw28]
MKFSELTPEQWAELQPYLDTAVLPVTGMSGSEMPYEATEALERLRDVLDLIEVPFKGRVVTYPACHYGEWSEETVEQVAKLCTNLKLRAGFRYVVIATASAAPEKAVKETGADVVIGPDLEGCLPSSSSVGDSIRRLWLGR